MRTEHIVRRVKSKLKIKKKLKELKDKLIKKKYKTLDEKNAIAYAREFGEKGFWKFDVKDDVKAEKGKSEGLPVIYVPIVKDGKDTKFVVWLDENIKELQGEPKSDFTTRHTPNEFRFTPLTEKNALDYIARVDSRVSIDKSRKIKKIKEDGESIIEVPILYKGEESTFGVWYSPAFRGLYGEW